MMPLFKTNEVKCEKYPPPPNNMDTGNYSVIDAIKAVKLCG